MRYDSSRSVEWVLESGIIASRSGFVIKTVFSYTTTQMPPLSQHDTLGLHN